MHLKKNQKSYLLSTGGRNIFSLLYPLKKFCQDHYIFIITKETEILLSNPAVIF